jgi:hypothetical protein
VPTRSILAEVSGAGIPGHEVILDNLHPNDFGHAQLAFHTAKFLVDRGLVPAIRNDHWGEVATELAKVRLPPELRRQKQMEAHAYLGSQYIAAGNLAAAEERFRKVFDEYGGRDEVTLTFLFKIYSKLGRQDEIRRIERIIEQEKKK